MQVAETVDEHPAVLVTGGAGYIGSHAALALLDAGRRVIVLDNLVTGFRRAVPEVAVFVEGDIADDALVRALLAEHGVGAIMHFAGSVVVAESVENPLKYYDNNTARSRSLIASALAGGVRHFIFSSTAAVYGVPSDEPVDESWPTRPANPYGTSKLMTETMLRDAAAAHGFNYGALRYFNVAGADPAGRAGQSTQGATNLIKAAVEVATGKRDSLAIFGDDWPTPDGTGVRDYIHVSDLVAAHIALLDRLEVETATSHVLNSGYGRGVSVREVIAAVERASGKPLPCHVAPRRPGDIAQMVANSDALGATIDWRPRFADLDAIVAHALHWERTIGAQLAD
ncbi:MAG: UDP-glucose 4-epimerase GalE [Sphingomonadaceae bacterium]|nr:UDP-glucose 4-epimerase GalE [Sphingomonadaceae bacterium]